MKARAKHTVKSIFLSMFVACFIILNSGCGLDEYYVLEPPTTYHAPVYSQSNLMPDAIDRYVEFFTNENSEYDDSGFEFTGTDVYYKIYSYLPTCESEYSALNTLVNSDASKANSASSLINSYKFQKLKINGSNRDVTIPHTTSKRSQRVRIRLTTFQDPPTSDDYKATVRIDGVNKGVPVRYYDNRSFDFYRKVLDSAFNAPLPRSTAYEDDLSSTTTVTEEGSWYITLYAVGVGHDSTFTQYYSTIAHLGTLCLKAGEYN